MQMAWDISDFQTNNPTKFLKEWATRDFSGEYADRIAKIMIKHNELGYARRPDNMVMYKGSGDSYTYDFFSISNYNDEAQRRLDEYDELDPIRKAIRAG